MAQVKGEFLADFASFYDAVTKAEVSLDGFEQSASKVERALDRAVNSFAGTKIVQQANLAVEAVKRLGDGTDVLTGATKLTAAEQAKLNSQLTEAIAKYNALGKEAPADMVALQKATAQVTEETNKVTKAVTAPKDSMAKSWVSDFTSQVSGMAAGMISAQAVISGFQAAWSGLVSFVGSSIESFAGAEAAAKKVDIALAGINQSTPRATAYMADLAEQFQNTTKYSDDLINEMQAMLIQVGQVLPADMEAALTASTDLASGLGIDLVTATNAVSKAFAGNTEGLKQYGIVIDEARMKTEGMPYVLDEINKRFGGQAAGELDTYAGKVEKLANQWDNVKEKYGQMIVQSPFLAAGLKAVEDQMISTGGATDSYTEALSRNLRSGGFKGYADLASILEGLAIQYTETGKTRAAFEDKKPSANESIRLGTAEDQARMLRTVNEELARGAEATKAKEQADKAAEAATKQHAAAVASLREQFSGDGVIKQTQLYIEALAGINDKSKLNADVQKQIQEQLWKAVEAYRAQGKEVPEIINTLIAETARYGDAIKVTTGLTQMPGTEVPLTKVTSLVGEMAENAKKANAALAETGVVGPAAMEKTAAATSTATQMIVQMNTALGANKSALESVLAGHELMKAYAASGVAMGNTLATGGYDFSMMQRSGMPTTNVARGLVDSTSNTLTVNVNNADAQGIASKLVNEMRHSGYRF